MSRWATTPAGVNGGNSTDGRAAGDFQDQTTATIGVDPVVRDVLRAAMLHSLTPQERLMIILWYVERMSMPEIAATLDMTELQVGRTHGLVLAKLRQELAAPGA